MLINRHKLTSFNESRFEAMYNVQNNGNDYPLQFIDPRRNTKWYAEKLINARHRVEIDYSVV